MAHLLKIRKGWENENLARFILSKFSFVSQPSTVADDVGADFFCTFFLKIAKDRKANNRIKDIFIYPKHSFAIQIKSSRNQINLTNKLAFFDNLETPFFIGVVNQEKLSMTIYSGDVIPEIFSLVGLPPDEKDKNITVKAILLDQRRDHGQQPRQAKYLIPFFNIGEILAGDTADQIKPFIERFSELCLNYQRNIISKKKHEYIFHDAVTLQPKILYGSGSYLKFRQNFVERLAEVFCNLAWAAPQITDKNGFLKEYYLYKKLYFEIVNVYGENDFLKSCFEKMEVEVQQILP